MKQGVERPAEIARQEERSGVVAGEQAARRRAAVELLAGHEATIRRTARRYSLCADDAEDAFQRALEILLTKAPTDRMRELVPWMQTVTKHEALAIRRKRERLLGTPPRVASADEEEVDWLALVPAAGDGPPDHAVRREAVARSREALRALKPAELRALTLLAEGYSYAEISEMTGYSRTKVNRCLAEGRERFRRLVSESEAGGRCAELEPMLSAFCDGEATDEQEAALGEHLRACLRCRSVLRAYRATPRAAAALAPGLPLSASLLGHAGRVLGRLRGRLSGRAGTGHSGTGRLGGSLASHGAGATAAKTLAVCAGTAGLAAAGMAVGIVPGPGATSPHSSKTPAIMRGSRPAADPGQRRQPAEDEPRTRRKAGRRDATRNAHRQAAKAPSPAPEEAPVEYEPPAPESTPPPAETTPPPETAPSGETAPTPAPAEAAAPTSGSAAGEFGP